MNSQGKTGPYKIVDGYKRIRSSDPRIRSAGIVNEEWIGPAKELETASV